MDGMHRSKLSRYRRKIKHTQQLSSLRNKEGLFKLFEEYGGVSYFALKRMLAPLGIYLYMCLVLIPVKFDESRGLSYAMHKAINLKECL